MEFTPTFETDLLPALAPKLHCETALIPYKVFTAYPRTPPHLRISIQYLYKLEDQVLNKEFIIFLDTCCFKQIFDILIMILLVTLLIAALQIEDFRAQNQLFNVRPYALTAEFVRACGQYVKITL